jgi:hypothetical protein
LLVKRDYLSMQKFLRQVAKRGLCCTKFFENRNANHFSKLNFKQLPGRAPRTWPKWGTSTIGYARTSDLVMNARFSPIGGTMRPVSRMDGKVVGVSVSKGVGDSDGEAGPTKPSAPKRAPPKAADRLDWPVPGRAPS